MMVARSDMPHKDKAKVSVDQAPEAIAAILRSIQKNYFDQAAEFRNRHIKRDLKNFEEFKEFFTPKNEEKPEIHGGFVLAKWCGDVDTEALLDPLKVTIRCLPLDQSGTEGNCILTGRPATIDAIFAKSY